MADEVRTSVNSAPVNAEATFETGATPGIASAAVTPSDTVPLSPVPRALFVGTGGNIAMKGLKDAAAVTWKNVGNASIIPFRAAYVMATNTTAADIVAIY